VWSEARFNICVMEWGGSNRGRLYEWLSTIKTFDEPKSDFHGPSVYFPMDSSGKCHVADHVILLELYPPVTQSKSSANPIRQSPMGK